MCETCRGRHRKYATTKRAKRKQEKAALGAQRIGNDDGRVVTWMPQDHHVSLGPIPDDLDPVQVWNTFSPSRRSICTDKPAV